MQGPLLAMLILTAWDQPRQGQRPFPEPPADSISVRVMVRIGQERQIRAITVERPVPDDEGDDPPPVRPAMRLNLNTAVVDRENFDRWVFVDGRSEPERRKYLEEILRSKVELAGVLHDLTAAQRAKLRLAGRGDIKRFFDQVEDRRNAFEIERRTFKTAYPALQRLVPLSQIYQEGPFDDGSLFAKTLRKIEDEQKAGR